jgi:hypothetical protein
VTEIIDVEGEEVTGTELEVRQAAPPATNLFRTDDPVQIVARATETANTLADVVRAKNLTKDIQGKQHVLVEGWTLLGSMLGVFPVTVWTQPVENGWEARVEARTIDGKIVGAAEAQCTRDERLWKTRDDYALRSMAQTRATSKALRQPLGFVMTLAGFEATPEAEMPAAEATVKGGKHDGPAPTKTQKDKLTKLLAKLEKDHPKPDGQQPWVQDVRRFCVEQFGTSKGEWLNKDEFQTLVDQVQTWLDNEEIPFG